MQFAKLLPLITSLTLATATETLVNTADELQAALSDSNPGDTIQLAPVTFQGNFVLSRSGTPHDLIKVIPSSEKTKIIGDGTGAAFTVVGSYWDLKALAISNYDVGVSIEGRGNKIKALAISQVNTGISVPGRDNLVSACAIAGAKQTGISVEGDRNTFLANSITGSTKSIVINEDACCGSLEANVASSVVDIKGTEFTINGNVFGGPLNIDRCKGLKLRMEKCKGHNMGFNVISKFF